MSDFPPVLTPRAPFEGLPLPRTVGRGVIAQDRDGLGVATVLSRKGKQEELALRLRERFGIDLPPGPHRTVAGELSLAGTGPGSWLAIQERGGNAFSASLRAAIGDVASISDQSDGYAVLRLSGPRVRDVLSKLVPIDVHPRVFAVGHVASSVAAYIGVTLWRLEDGKDGAPVFEIALYRSLAEDFWNVLTESAAEFGIVVA